MGCWNGTCMISNLPILAGDRIKVVILRPSYSMNRIKQGAGYVYSGDLLTPSFLPISGEYNDYGMIENIVDDWNSHLIEGTLKHILGAKIIADGEEKTDYNLEDILEGIERNNLQFFGVDPEEVQRKLLAERVCGVYDKSGYSSEKVEKEWKELLILDITEKLRQYNASFVMIREDIWNFIIDNYQGEFWNPKKKENSDKNVPYHITAKEWCAHEFNEKMDNIFISQYAGEGHLLRPDLYNAVLRKASEELKEDIFKMWSEFTIINSFISGTRKGWMIQAGAGSQHSGWKEHKILAEKIIEICDKKMSEDNYEEE